MGSLTYGVTLYSMRRLVAGQGDVGNSPALPQEPSFLALQSLKSLSTRIFLAQQYNECKIISTTAEIRLRLTRICTTGSFVTNIAIAAVQGMAIRMTSDPLGELCRIQEEGSPCRFGWIFRRDSGAWRGDWRRRGLR